MLRNLDVIQSRHIIQCRFVRLISTTDPTEPTEGSSKNQIKYALKQDYSDLKDKFRAKREATADTGLKPTNWEKRLLVLTRLYGARDSIPEYVPADTMRLMNNRVRAYVVITIALTFSTVWILGNSKISQNQAALNNAIVFPLETNAEKEPPHE